MSELVETAERAPLPLGEHLRALKKATSTPREPPAEDSEQPLLPFPRGLFARSAALVNDKSDEAGQVHALLLFLCGALNYEFVGESTQRLSSAAPSRLQAAALGRLTEEVETYPTDTEGAFAPKDWESEMKASAVSYSGEEIFPAEDLVPSRLAEALPPASFGAAVEATKVCEGSLKQRLADPEALLLPHSARGELPAAHPRVGRSWCVAAGGQAAAEVWHR